MDKQWQYEEYGILDRAHLRFFTEKSIRNTFDQLGYELLELKGINAFDLSWKFNLLNFITFGHLNDTKYLQFACVAKARGGSDKK